MIIAQVCLRLATIKGHSKMCSFVTQHNATDIVCFEGVCTCHADCRNVHQSWIECSFLYHKPSPKAFQRIWQYINRPHNRRPRVTTPAQDLHIQHLDLQDRLRPATRTAAATISLQNQIITAQTVRNRLREANLHARRPHRGLDLTTVRRRNRLEWSNAHIRWHLALWRGVLFTDESRFSLYRADGRQHVWRCVDRVAHGGGGVMVWYGQAYVMDNKHRCIFWWHFECTEIPWRDPEAHCCVSFKYKIIYNYFTFETYELTGHCLYDWVIN